MPPEDLVRPRHIIEAGETVAGFIAGRTRVDLDHDRMLVFALVRAIEVMDGPRPACRRRRAPRPRPCPGRR